MIAKKLRNEEIISLLENATSKLNVSILSLSYAIYIG